MASKSKARGLKGIIVAVALLVFTIYVVISLILIGNDIKAKRQETVELQAQIVDLIDNGADAEYIIKIAKEKLGLVYPDERVYVDISGN